MHAAGPSPLLMWGHAIGHFWTQTIVPALYDAFDFAHQGFLQANLALGLIIAVIAAFTLGRYRPRAVITATIGATLLFLLAQKILLPALENKGRLALPDIMVASFWHQAALLLAGLFVMITILYVLRKAFLGGGGHH